MQSHKVRQILEYHSSKNIYLQKNYLIFFHLFYFICLEMKKIILSDFFNTLLKQPAGVKTPGYC